MLTGYFCRTESGKNWDEGARNSQLMMIQSEQEKQMINEVLPEESKCCSALFNLRTACESGFREDRSSEGTKDRL